MSCIRRRIVAGLLPLLSLLAAGCGSLPVENQPLQALAPPSQAGTISTGGYRRASLAGTEAASDTFVVLAFSGGGKRSAAFSYGVLSGLRDVKVPAAHGARRLLDLVDVIASVSGGSFTSAYYGLYRDRIFADYERDFLKRDIDGYIVGTYLLPWRWRWIFDPNFGTNDEMAAIYDRLMFHGATYRDLQAKGLPLINIDATDINYGAVFPFNQDQFDLICSDLSSYPIARAVAASNGFPVIFSPINLRDYAGKCDGRVPDWIRHAKREEELTREGYLARIAERYLDPDETQYVHLMDGGISDNLAMRGMINNVLSFGESLAAYRRAGAVPIRRILVISADGQAAANRSWPKERTVTGIGQIFAAVSGAQIDAYNFETLLLARRLVGTFARSVREVRCHQQAIIAGYPCADVKAYFLHLSLADIADPALRNRLQSIPTGLTISDEAVGELTRAGETLVRDSPLIARFRRELAVPLPASATGPDALVAFE